MLSWSRKAVKARFCRSVIASLHHLARNGYGSEHVGPIGSCGRRSFISAKDRGQPSPDTHPELLQRGEILPGVPAAEFAARRQSIMERLPDATMLVVAAAPVKHRAGVIPYPYRQAADYFYVTGCCQPGGTAAIYRLGGGETSFSLFMPTPLREVEAWDGHVADCEDAAQFFSADAAFPSTQLNQAVERHLGAGGAVHFDANSAPGAALMLRTPALSRALATGRVHSPRAALHQARWVKSAAELSLMRTSADIVCQALAEVMSWGGETGDTFHEHRIEAALEFGCRRRGAQHMAFPSVVASGAAACAVHYSRHDKPVRAGDALLVDAGCEYFGYCSDVTRVWVPRGTFSPAQREVYEAVMEVTRECVALCQPGNNLRAVHEHSVRRLCEQMVRLGVFSGRSADSIAASGAYKLFYPTSVGHWLGLDVHDCASVGLGETLRPGVVLTVEPGLYFPPGAPEVPLHLQGIGVRVEEDVLIGPSGPEVLSSALPVDVEAIEALTNR